jgi:hypothetical protein
MPVADRDSLHLAWEGGLHMWVTGSAAFADIRAERHHDRARTNRAFGGHRLWGAHAVGLEGRGHYGRARCLATMAAPQCTRCASSASSTPGPLLRHPLI